MKVPMPPPSLSVAWLALKLIVGVMLALNLGEAVVVAYQQF